MRRKKTDYTGNYSPKVKYNTCLSQDTGKHKSKVESMSSKILDSYGRYHTGKHSQYRLKIAGNSLVIVISQYGEINHKVREFTLGDVTENSQLKLNQSIYLSNKIPSGNIFNVADLIGVDTDSLIRQLQDYVSKHVYLADPEREKTQFKTISGPNFKVKRRI
jgi:hypothetical protein